MPPTPSFVVIAEFAVPLPHRHDFLDLCAFDSLRSLTDEPGCHQFDVVTSPDDPTLVILYEVYTDQAAFNAHMCTPHYVTFAAGVDRLDVGKIQVRFFTRQAV
jgi:quinol monooxygenase YgiN